MDAGFYNVRFIWLKQSYVPDETRGDPNQETFAPQIGPLWGNLQLVSSSEEQKMGGGRAMATATIRLRGIPPISALDRLQDGWGRIWWVDGRRVDFQNWEVICDAHEFDEPAGL